MAGVVYLADTTVYFLQGRHGVVRRRFETLLAEGRLAGCQMSALEYLNGAPDPKGCIRQEIGTVRFGPLIGNRLQLSLNPHGEHSNAGSRNSK
jgi:hypothetical protein